MKTTTNQSHLLEQGEIMHNNQRNKLFQKHKLWSKAVRTLDTKLQVYTCLRKAG